MSHRYVLKQIQKNINFLPYNSLKFSVYWKIFKIKYRGKLHTHTCKCMGKISESQCNHTPKYVQCFLLGSWNGMLITCGKWMASFAL